MQLRNRSDREFAIELLKKKPIVCERYPTINFHYYFYMEKTCCWLYLTWSMPNAKPNASWGYFIGLTLASAEAWVGPMKYHIGGPEVS